MWWASSLRDQRLVHELLELAREELAGVVGVNGRHHAHDGVRAQVGQRIERCNEPPDAVGCLRLGLEEVDELETGVIIGEHEGVLEAS